MDDDALEGLRTPGLSDEILRLRAVVQASRLVHASGHLDELLDTILSVTTTVVGAERGTFYVCDHAKQEIWSRVNAGSGRVEIRLPFGQGLAGTAVTGAEPLIVEDPYSHPGFDPEVDRRTGFRTRNLLTAPVRDGDGSVVAVLQLLNKDGGFSVGDLDFLELMGGHMAQALANVQAVQTRLESQRLLKEMDMARRIQRQLLPAKLPSLPGLDLGACLVPSRQVAGDYYDVIPTREGRTLLLLADVSGKGVPAALVMANVEAALWATANLGLDLVAWARHLHSVLYDHLEGAQYVTAFLLEVTRGTREARFLNAGHPPGLLLQGERYRLDSTGPPLGLLPSPDYEAGTVTLEPGSSLLLYSDGLLESPGDDGEELGVEGLETLLGGVTGLPAAEGVSAILAHIATDPERDDDDRTVMLVRSIGD